MKLKLNEDAHFAVEADRKQLRLIVFKNGEEFVCRKESKKGLEDFLAGQEAHAFKGRLQLWKKSANIFVEVKGQITGVLAVADFEKLLKNAGIKQPVNI